MNHRISYYDENYKRVAFCVYCSCENVVKLLKDNCPGEYKDDLDKPVDIDNEEA